MIKILLAIICFIAATPVVSAPSEVSYYSVSISLQEDTLRRVIDIRGIQGSDRLLSRITRGFNPETQSVLLERAVFGVSEGETGPIPEWAVDTLSCNDGWQLALVTAFPALREGMTIDYRIAVTDWSGNWENGAWAVLSPSVKGISPDTCHFSVSGDMVEKLNWQGRGYEISRRGETIEFTATDSSGILVISPFSTYGELSIFVMREAIVTLDSPYPPDLREAALQATSAGADQHAQTERARSLLCNSFNPCSAVQGRDVSAVQDLQEILDQRRGTALEMALVFAAMCRELGIEADIIPASGIDYGIPVPAGWNRFLVKLESDYGEEWFMEPSAFLTSASFIYRPDTLYIIENGNLRTMPPNEPRENRSSEEWHIDCADGTFSLKMECSGWYDIMLRRMLAGLSSEEMLLTLSEWSWLSGRTIIPDSLTVSDPFDLGANMTLSVYGKLWIPIDASLAAEYLPLFDWSKPENVTDETIRTWALLRTMDVHSSFPLIMEILNDTVILTDTSGINNPLPIIFKVTE
ncbi:MAG: transglutaminase-like domain-containing protein [Candidatus Aegiribacteria sp.]|nr:transglutaminase-like domain-containing protein [Candidatus Aegiribacteria sp.]